MRRQPEKIEQAHIVTLLRRIGAAVYVLGHPSPADGRRHRGTGQTPGIADLYVVLPPPLYRKGCPIASVAAWIEVKAAGGRLSPEQDTFRAHCQQAGVPHLVGGLQDVIDWLAEGGWIKAETLPHYKQPRATAQTQETPHVER